MTEPCGITHPDHPEVACNIREPLADHEEHLGFKPGEGVIEWPNPSYQPKVRVTPRGRRPAAEVAAEINRETIELSRAAANAPGLLREDSGDTEINAAFAVMPGTGTQRMAVLMAIRDAGAEGATDDQIVAILDSTYSKVGPRRRELMAGGWVVDSTRRRLSESGQESIVWVLTPEAQSKL